MKLSDGAQVVDVAWWDSRSMSELEGSLFESQRCYQPSCGIQPCYVASGDL